MARIRASALLALLAALAIASCGGSNDESTAPSSGPGGNGGQRSESRPGAQISSGVPDGIGPLLVDEEGHTIYAFEGDTRGDGKSACYGKCANAWPPVSSAGEPRVYAGTRVRAPLLGTIERRGGGLQVTYGGWPLYTLKGEHGADATGVGVSAFGARWYPLRLNGKLLRG